MTHPDPDPLDVTAEEVWRRLEATPGFNERVAEGRAQLAAGQRVKFDRFREQRRRSRWGCSVALVALTLACLVFWAAVLFVAVNVFAAPRGADQHANGGSDPFATPFRPAVDRVLGAPLPASVDGPPDRGKGTLGDAGNGTSWRQTDNGNAAANPVFDGPMDPPRLRSSWNGQDKAGPSHSGAAVGAPLPPVYTGKLGYALPSHGSRYLAIRWPRGTVATLCGPADCVTRTSTDFGPVRSLWEAGRLADLSAVDWQRVCGQPLRFGLCPGTLLIVSRPRTLPETDTR